MAKPLDDYRKKRDFGKTAEPEGRRKKRPKDSAVFVVHRHEASRTHYDLRLEMEGVLKSWAVPRGFSYDPKEKRLAVRTEDHPIEYESFEGVIPAGQYGAGTMTIWDRGVFEVVKSPDGPTAIASGELKVILSGRKLRGEWHLVETKADERSWLLFKSKDRYAGPDRDSALGIDLAGAERGDLPKRLTAMRPGSRSAPFSDPEWLFEARFEGRRCFAEKRGDAVRLRGIRRAFGELEAALGGLRAETALLDGVLVALDDDQRPSRERLDAALSGAAGVGVVYYAFDLLHFDGFDLRPLPTLERKTALRAILPEASAPLLYVDHVLDDGLGLANVVARAGLPGIVAKRADAPWAGGERDAWRLVDVDAAPAAGPVAGILGDLSAAGGSGRVRYTNVGKVFWPAEGYTKGDLIGYYERVADTLLPYLRERPVHMFRFPDGIEGKSFYQKQVKDGMPDWIETIPIEVESRGETVPYMICNDRDTLIWLVNMGSIDLHPWMSRRGSLDSPDYAVIDLDPKDAPFTDVIRIARACGEVLHDVGLRPVLKTSGASGIHVVIALEPGYTYDHTRMFCEGVARYLCRQLPEIATVERSTSRREGKVYVDFLQNAREQTIVPPYVARPVPGATVSTPLAWDELTDDLRPSWFTIRNVPERVARLGDLFAGVLNDPQDLIEAAEALEKRLRG